MDLSYNLQKHDTLCWKLDEDNFVNVMGALWRQGNINITHKCSDNWVGEQNIPKLWYINKNQILSDRYCDEILL